MTVTRSVPERGALDTRRACAECGERSGSVSKGTGRPLVLDKETGRWLHVRCRAQADTLDAQWSGLERLSSI